MNNITWKDPLTAQNQMTYLSHYGTKRHSGRYPWGSGKEPYQNEKDSGSHTKRLITKDDFSLPNIRDNIKELQELGVKVDDAKNLYFPKGMTIQRCSTSKNETGSSRVYCSFLNHDNGTYSSNEFWEYKPETDSIYIKKYKLKKEMKVLNTLSALEIINKNADKKASKLIKKIKNGLDSSTLSIKEYEPLKRVENKFDSMFKNKNDLNFSTNLIKNDYGATIDIYDSGYGGAYADMPIIVLNPQKYLQLVSNTKKDI